MKKISKIIVAILGLAIILTVGVLAVSAEDGGTQVTYVLEGVETKTESVSSLPTYAVGDYVEYKYDGWRASYRVKSVSQNGNTLTVVLDFADARYFSVTDASGNVTYVTKEVLGNPETTDELLIALSAKFHSSINNAPEGTRIQLLADVKDRELSTIGIYNTTYFDLNGFNFVSTGERANSGTKSGFGVGATSFYMFSSRPGGNFFLGVPYASYKESIDPETQEPIYTITEAAPRAYSAFDTTEGHIYLGRFGDIDGDNLSIYTNMLANIKSNVTDGSYALSIDGGYYHKYCTAYMAGMFYFRDNTAAAGELNISIKNATLYSKDYLFYYYNSSPVANAVKNFNLDIDNSVLKADLSIFTSLSYLIDRVTVNLDNSYILSPLGVSQFLDIGEGCRFSNVGADVKYLYFARISDKKPVTIKTNEFIFTDYEVDTALGCVTANFDPSSFDVFVTDTEYFFSYATASEENSSLITWIDHNGNVTTERWLNGELPRPKDALPEATDTYYYTYGEITTVAGDKTYVAKPVAKFGLKINLTLASDFIYNVYVPESAAESIKEVRVYKSNGEGVVLERGELATINGTPYYRYFFNIQASLAADAYSFDMDIYTDKESGEYFTQECEMSIPAYCAEIIYNEKYSDSTHDLMNKVLAYVKAACDYFKTSAQNKYYGVIGKIPSVTAPTVREGAPVQDISETTYLKNTLSSISVIFGSQLKYRFYFKSGVDFESTSVAFSYIINGAVTKVPVTNENINSDAKGRYYDVPLKASDMRSDVILSVNSESFTYNLSNYVYEVNLGSDNVAKQLVYSLWDYSLAAGSFNNETPDVDVSINGTPISDYKIVANTEEELLAAEAFRAVIAKEHGVNLEIVSSYNGKAIEFKSVSPDSIIDFAANLVGDNLVIECAYRSFFESAAVAFSNDVFANLNRDLDISGEFSRQYLYGKILYSDFDVPKFNGKAPQFDGKSIAEIAAMAGENAYFAIKHAHDVANAKGYPVYADKDATYYIGTSKDERGNIQTVTIKTDTYWQGADFIIDDTSLSRLDGSENDAVAASPIFLVANDQAAISVSPDLLLDTDENGKKTLSVTDTKFKTGLGYSAMLFITNSDVTQYIRFGYTTKQGRSQQELVIIDENGNIDPTTPLLFDFNNVTSISAYRADTRPIVIDGGEGCTMTTLSSQIVLHSISKTISRYIDVERSNTTVKNIEHIIYNEPETYDANDTTTGGHSYTGFFGATRATNITFENCVAQARNRCKEGTYDIGLSYANNVVYRNFTQSNFFQEGTQVPDTTRCWWVMGSNYCKNITYDNCVLTRFDAHAGVYNATVKNSVTSSIRLTGGGTFLLENTTVYARSGMANGFIELREDYGSTWKGDIKIKDVHYVYTSTPGTVFSVIRGNWEHHDFGYETTLPNVSLDNITFSSNVAEKLTDIYVFNITNAVDQSYTYFVTEKVTYDGKEQTVTKKITDVFDDETYAALQSLDDLRVEHFEGTISRTIVYTVEDSNKAKHEITETETVVGFDNVNPYTAPKRAVIMNMGEEYNYHLTKTLAATFSDTVFKINPPDFDGFDTPVIDYTRP